MRVEIRFPKIVSLEFLGIKFKYLRSIEQMIPGVSLFVPPLPGKSSDLVLCIVGPDEKVRVVEDMCRRTLESILNDKVE